MNYKKVDVSTNRIMSNAKAIKTISTHLQNDYDPQLVHAIMVLADNIITNDRSLQEALLQQIETVD